MATAVLTRTACDTFEVRRRISADIETVREAALSRDNVDEWPFIKEFQVLRETDVQSVCYVRSGFPGLDDRDLTVVVTHPEVRRGEVVIDFRIDSPKGPPRRHDAVRVSHGEGSLRLRTSGESTDAIFVYEIDPKVRLPAFVKRVLLKQAGAMMVALLGHVSRVRDNPGQFEFRHLLP